MKKNTKKQSISNYSTSGTMGPPRSAAASHLRRDKGIKSGNNSSLIANFKPVKPVLSKQTQKHSELRSRMNSELYKQDLSNRSTCFNLTNYTSDKEVMNQSTGNDINNGHFMTITGNFTNFTNSHIIQKQETQRINSAHMKILDSNKHSSKALAAGGPPPLKMVKAQSKPNIHNAGAHPAHKCLVNTQNEPPKIRSEQISASQLREKMVKTELVENYQRKNIQQSANSTFYGGTSEWDKATKMSPSFTATNCTMAVIPDYTGRQFHVQSNPYNGCTNINNSGAQSKQSNNRHNASVKQSINFNLSPSSIKQSVGIRKLPSQQYERKVYTSNDRIISSSYQTRVFENMEKKAAKQEKLNYQIIQKNRGKMSDMSHARKDSRTPELYKNQLKLKATTMYTPEKCLAQRKIKGDDPIEAECFSNRSFGSNCSQTFRFKPSALWTCNRVNPIKPGSTIRGLFEGGMGVEAKKSLRASFSQPRLKTQGQQKQFNRQRDRSYVEGSMKQILNHTTTEFDLASQTSGGIGIVKKEFLPTYRKNEREKSNISSTYDPLFQQKMRPADLVMSNEVEKIVFSPKNAQVSQSPQRAHKASAKKMFVPVKHFCNLDNSLVEKISTKNVAQNYRENVVSKQVFVRKSTLAVSKNESQLTDILQHNFGTVTQRNNQLKQKRMSNQNTITKAHYLNKRNSSNVCQDIVFNKTCRDMFQTPMNESKKDNSMRKAQQQKIQQINQSEHQVKKFNINFKDLPTNLKNSGAGQPKRAMNYRKSVDVNQQHGMVGSSNYLSYMMHRAGSTKRESNNFGNAFQSQITIA